MEYEEKFVGLMREAENLAFGDQKVQVLQEAVKLADLHQNLNFQYFSRVQLAAAGIFSGYSELMLIHFPWIRATSQANPTQFEPNTYGWMYSWVVIIMIYSPQIPLEMIHEAARELEVYFQENGRTHRSLLEIQRTIHILTGDKKTASQKQEAYALTEKASEMAYIFGLENHQAIEIHNEGFYFQRIGEIEKSIQILMPVLTGQVDFELSLPYTLSSSVVPLVELGNWELAEECFQKGVKIVRNQRKYKNLQPEFLSYLALKGDLVAALNFFERHIGFWEQAHLGQERFDYFKAGRLYFEILSQNQIKEIKISLPKAHPQFRADHTYNTSEMEQYYADLAAQVAKDFDDRNGNDAYSQLYQRSLGLSQHGRKPTGV